MRRCIIFSSILSILILFSLLPASAQIVTESSAIFLPLPEDEPQREVSLNVAHEGQQGDDPISFRVRVIPGELDLENRVVRDDRGGPDEMDYEWRDSNEDDGPIYDWIDIIDWDGTIDLEANDDDSLYGPFDLAFVANYYGNEYEEIWIDANGFVTFIRTALFPFYNDFERLPNANPGDDRSTPPRTFIACNFQDLDPSQGGNIYYWCDESMAVITWDDIPHFGIDGGDNWTFQMIITADGLIKYQYRIVGSYDQRPDIIIGLQNEDRDLGFTVAYNTNQYIEEELAVAFGQPAAWVNWLSVDPVESELEVGADVDLTLALDFEGLDPGYYYCSLMLDLEGDLPDVTIPVVMSFAAPVGGLAGVVTDAATGDEINDAMVTINEIAYTITGSEFALEDLPVGLWSITVTAPDFNQMDLAQVEIVEGEVTELEIELLHGTFTLDPEEINEQLAPDTDVEIAVTASNDGNAPVNFTAERRLLGDANAEPWDLRREFNWGQQIEDDRLQGVAFANGNFYVPGADGDNANQIYVLNSGGELIDQFDQAGESRYGMRDLAFDGELLWGSNEQDIFGYDLEGDLQARFEGPFNPTINLAWDPDRELFWVSGTTTDIQAVDREGNAAGNRLNRRGFRVYGLAYYPEDPDGFNLYILNSPGAGVTLIHKMDTENGDTMLVRRIDPANVSGVEGIEITNSYDIYSWVVLTMINVAPANGGDRMEIYQLDSRKDWMEIEPVEGVVEADGEVEFTLTLDATGLPEAEFEGEILFTHNGRGGETHLSITLGVVFGPAQAVRDIQLERGWNLISANLQPNEEDVRVLTTDLVENDLLIMMKDGFGHFYRPAAGFNNIPGWDVAQGYQMKVTEDAVLSLEGLTVMADEPIQLREGWQMVAYYPRVEIDPRIALAGIVDNLVVVKDGDGNFFLPAFNFSNMPPMREGQGYQMKSDAEVELVYQQGERLAAAPVHRVDPVYFTRPKPTGGNMSVLLSAEWGVRSAECFEVGVFTESGRLVGSSSSSSFIGLAVWADDPVTPEIDGAVAGERLEFRLWDGMTETSILPKWEEGDGSFQTDDILIGAFDASEGSQLSAFSFQLYPSFPNPFNSTTMISYSLPEAGPVEISLFDQTGRLVSVISQEVRDAGRHELTIEAGSLPSGLYVVKVTTPSASLKGKLMLIR